RACEVLLTSVRSNGRPELSATRPVDRSRKSPYMSEERRWTTSSRHSRRPAALAIPSDTSFVLGEVTSPRTRVLKPGMFGVVRVARSLPPLARNQSHRIGSALSAVRYGPVPVLTFGP